ncbi:MAG: insulinase family protein [Lachnospiraceae bacterium]|nr:insulinase family protein [Lachnospiraceae bacterium]
MTDKRNKKIHILFSLLLSIIMFFSFAACYSYPMDQQQKDNKEVNRESDNLSLKVGDELWGFTLENIRNIDIIDSVQYDFIHKYSGARLVYYQNPDKELSFSISFKTPQADETDTNHVFEHSILAGSHKYPSKNLLFDLSNKSFSTYVNATTFPLITSYMLASESEKQLIKLVDAYMSCMADPLILEDENIFKREALHYELESGDSDIEMLGTVFSEDLSYLTDNYDNMNSLILKTLFPGDIASNVVGRAHINYKELTYEHTKETYNRYYHFDNCLLGLYGDLNIEEFLKLLDKEYLSEAKSYGTDLSDLNPGKSKEGFEAKEYDIPAYNGDNTGNMSEIAYAISTEDLSFEELIACDLISSVLSMNSSDLNTTFKEENIQSPVYVSNIRDCIKNYFAFQMSYTDARNSKRLKELADAILLKISKEGLNKELLEAELSNMKKSVLLMRDSGSAGNEILTANSIMWGNGYDNDYYPRLNESIEKLSSDDEQSLIKAAAKKLLEAKRSALITGSPREGMAEEYEKELRLYLDNMKAGLTKDEISKLVEDTKEYKEWVNEEEHNNSFLIDPLELPEYETGGEIENYISEGISVYQGSTDTENIGYYKLYFDLTGMDKKEIQSLMSYIYLGNEPGSKEHSSNELDVLESRYVDSLVFDLAYTNSCNGKEGKPYLRVGFKCLTEDFEEALLLVLERLTALDLTKEEEVAYILSRDVEIFNSSANSGYDLAASASHRGVGLFGNKSQFEYDILGPDFYSFQKDMLKRIDEDKSYISKVVDDFDKARKKAISRSGLIFIQANSKAEQQEVTGIAVDHLKRLPEKTKDIENRYSLPEFDKKKIAIIKNDTLQNSCMSADLGWKEELKGEYIPWIYALSDKYILPNLRFKAGAYSAEAYYEKVADSLLIFSYADPNVGKTVEIYDGAEDFLQNMNINEDELKGYTLNAYADASRTDGVLSDMINLLTIDVMGGDHQSYVNKINDIRNCSISHQKEATDKLITLMGKGRLCMTGNEISINSDKEYFDEVITVK